MHNRQEMSLEPESEPEPAALSPSRLLRVFEKLCKRHIRLALALDAGKRRAKVLDVETVHLEEGRDGHQDIA